MVTLSFSQKIKNELCLLPLGDRDCVLAELYGVLLFANVFRAEEIRIITQNACFAKRVSRLFSRALGLRTTAAQSAEHGRYVWRLNDTTAIFHVFSVLGLDPDATVQRLHGVLLDRPECRNAFLRGIFLSGGSVSDPEVRYHLEFSTPYRGICTALTEFFEDLALTPHTTMRAGKYLLYFKRSEAIEDILTRTGAQKSALAVMHSKVVKEVRNNVNRYVNCETANISKTVEAAQTQTQAIRTLTESGRLDTLPEVLRETAQIRMENPEASLSALGKLFSPPVNRATLNYRLKKLVEISRLPVGKEEQT